GWLSSKGSPARQACRCCGWRPAFTMTTRWPSIARPDSSNARRSVITSRTRSVYSWKSASAGECFGGGMPGNLSFNELKKAVSAGAIDTVIAAMVDMQGRLVGKRFQAEYFVDGA